MPIQEIQTLTKETQKTVLKTICESPTLSIEELTLLLKSKIKNITQEEVLQVIHSISPNKNWHRATADDVQKEILNYLWTLEAQILFLLPTKQKKQQLLSLIKLDYKTNNQKPQKT